MNLLGHVKEWGVGLVHASHDNTAKEMLEICRKLKGDFVVVGYLYKDNEHFVFRYASDYSGDPISSFPLVDQVYRSETLWPFFAVRIPPLDRADVRETMKKRALEGGQTIRVLHTVAEASPTNPYEFRLAE